MEKYTIISNASGTRNMEISETNLKTIQKYNLFDGLIGSNGIIDDSSVSHLQHLAGGLIDSSYASDNDLLDFYREVLAHPNMKATCLRNLMQLYAEWAEKHPVESSDNAEC